MANHSKSSRRRHSHGGQLATYLWSLIPGLGIPLVFTYIYSTTLNFSPLYTWLVTLNLTLVGLMGKDKLAATRQWPRTPEFTLLLLTFLGATPAILTASYIFNHKTSKESFRYALFGTIAAQALAIWYFWPNLQQYL